MRVALYVRCSTNDQTVAPQLDALRAYAAARGLEIAEVYADEGVSGARDRRPALDRLLADARRKPRPFDAILAWKLDRIGRSLPHLLRLVEQLDALGVGLICAADPIDTSSAQGRLVFGILGSLAQFERELIAERTRAGMAAAKRRGKRIGRPRALRGPASLEMERMVRGGSSFGATARKLGVHTSTVSREAKRLGLVATAVAV